MILSKLITVPFLLGGTRIFLLILSRVASLARYLMSESSEPLSRASLVCSMTKYSPGRPGMMTEQSSDAM